MAIRVTLEIIPRGDESKKFVAGTLDIENDGTAGAAGPNTGTGHYFYTLRGPVQGPERAIPDEFWERGRLENFERRRGWWACVKEVLGMAETDYDPPAGLPAATGKSTWNHPVVPGMDMPAYLLPIANFLSEAQHTLTVRGTRCQVYIKREGTRLDGSELQAPVVACFYGRSKLLHTFTPDEFMKEFGVW